MNVHFRHATKEDFTKIMLLYKQLWEEWDYIEEKALEIYKKDLVTGRKEYLLAINDENIVGACSIYYKEDLHRYSSAILDELVVDKEYRNKGIGGALLEEALRIVKERKCNFLSLESGFKRIDAHKLYKSKGFEKRGYYFKKIF